MTKPLMPAWKLALFVLLGSFAILVVLSMALPGDSTGASPRERGEKVGRQFGAFVIFAPIVAYVVQKSRIDSANRTKRD